MILVHGKTEYTRIYAGEGWSLMSNYVITRSDEYLAHHGIKGQKWGQRRYQNSDGSLTAEGRKHYGVAEGGSGSMSRKFNREVKKLNKLRDRADFDVQRQNAARYDRRARTGLKIAGAGAAIAGAGAAAEYGGGNVSLVGNNEDRRQKRYFRFHSTIAFSASEAYNARLQKGQP